MTSKINFSSVAQGTLWAMAAVFSLTPGRAVSALLLGMIGNLGLSLYGRTIEQPSYRTVKYDNFKRIGSEGEIEGALWRLQKEYPKEYGLFLQENNLSSEMEALAFFKTDLDQGCCAGVANALFDKIVRGHSRSLMDSYQFVSKEDVFYFQMLQNLRICDDEKLTAVEARILVVKKCMETRTGIETIDEDSEVLKNQLLHKYQKRNENLARNDHYRTFLNSEKFPIKSDVAVYRQCFENALLKFPEETDFVGVVLIPKHVISFQYGPQGYLICDPILNISFTECPNPNIFFLHLQALVQYDVRLSKCHCIEKEKPEATPEEVDKEIEERLNDIKPCFSISPLHRINPLLGNKN